MSPYLVPIDDKRVPATSSKQACGEREKRKRAVCTTSNRPGRLPRYRMTARPNRSGGTRLRLPRAWDSRACSSPTTSTPGRIGASEASQRRVVRYVTSCPASPRPTPRPRIHAGTANGQRIEQVVDEADAHLCHARRRILDVRGGDSRAGTLHCTLVPRHREKAQEERAEHKLDSDGEERDSKHHEVLVVQCVQSSDCPQRRDEPKHHRAGRG